MIVRELIQKQVDLAKRLVKIANDWRKLRTCAQAEARSLEKKSAQKRAHEASSARITLKSAGIAQVKEPSLCSSS